MSQKKSKQIRKILIENGVKNKKTIKLALQHYNTLSHNSRPDYLLRLGLFAHQLSKDEQLNKNTPLQKVK